MTRGVPSRLRRSASLRTRRSRQVSVASAIVWLAVSLFPVPAAAQTGEEPNPVFSALRGASERLAPLAEQAGTAFATAVNQIRDAVLATGPVFDSLEDFTSQLGQAVDTAHGSLDQAVAALAPLLAALAPIVDQAAAGIAAAELAGGDAVAGRDPQLQQMGSALTSNPVTAAPLCGFQRPGGIALSLLPGALRMQEAFASLTAPCSEHPPSGPPSQLASVFEAYAGVVEDGGWALAPIGPALQPAFSIACPVFTPFGVIPIFFPSPAPIGPVFAPLSFFACGLGDGASVVGPVLLFAAMTGGAVEPTVGDGASLLAALSPVATTAAPVVYPHTAGSCALIPLAQIIPTLLLPLGAPVSPTTVIAPIGALACPAAAGPPVPGIPPLPPNPPIDLPLPPVGPALLPPSIIAPPVPEALGPSQPSAGAVPGPLLTLITFEWIYLALLGLLAFPSASKATRGAVRHWARDQELVDTYHALRA